ncbi:phosphoribosylanthranilate isomerase [Roseivirga sp. E12]|uniref:phosphoribosylanthranilate isomerase n=1 Tax=Roseivirga sp. E12 TaxID=2819237 RepID=UPI001ABC6417|nr:phosphoribosylanthranilate isomerase [Roseivirga sp. E12]MBO3696838.1 phosphoribosylanthranilate isomerase [Roseivirga sp. E12]
MLVDYAKTFLELSSLSMSFDLHPISRTKIKICCIASLEEALMAINAGADALGFVCAIPTSSRTIDKQKVAEITPHIPSQVATSVLTSELTASSIAENVRLTGTSRVQILSHITSTESKRLSELIPDIQRVQIIHIESKASLGLIDQYASYVDFFQLDSGRPNLKVPEFGGTGRTHDWSISAEFVKRSPRPVFLAGGLTPENVIEAIRRVRPFGVDLCSGVRTDGRLDPDKLKVFIDNVRKTDADLYGSNRE